MAKTAKTADMGMPHKPSAHEEMRWQAESAARTAVEADPGVQRMKKRMTNRLYRAMCGAMKEKPRRM